MSERDSQDNDTTRRPAFFRQFRKLIADAKSVHVEKAGWYFALGCSLLFSIVHRSITDAVAKQRTERTEALKTDFEANVGDCQPPVPEQLLRLFNSAANQILVWRRLNLFAKQTKKMIARKSCCAGHLIQIDGLLIPLMNEGARATEPLVNLAAGFGFGLRHCEADFTARIAASERILPNLSILRLCVIL